jgi:hypothetical protein
MGDFTDYQRQVVSLARVALSTIPQWRGMVCVDTIQGSWENGLPIATAAEIAVDDTLYWDGCYTT